MLADTPQKYMPESPLISEYSTTDHQDAEVLFSLLGVTENIAAAAIMQILYLWEIRDGQLMYEKSILNDANITALQLFENQDFVLGNENGVVGLWRRNQQGWEHRIDFFTKHSPIQEIHYIHQFDLLITKFEHSIFKLGNYLLESEVYVPKQEITQCQILEFCESNQCAVGGQQNQLTIFQYVNDQYVRKTEVNIYQEIKQITWISENSFATAQQTSIKLWFLRFDFHVQLNYLWHMETDYMVYNKFSERIYLQNIQGLQVLEYYQKEINVLETKEGNYSPCKISFFGQYILLQNRENCRIEIMQKY